MAAGLTPRPSFHVVEFQLRQFDKIEVVRVPQQNPVQFVRSGAAGTAAGLQFLSIQAKQLPELLTKLRGAAEAAVRVDANSGFPLSIVRINSTGAEWIDRGVCRSR